MKKITTTLLLLAITNIMITGCTTTYSQSNDVKVQDTLTSFTDTGCLDETLSLDFSDVTVGNIFDIIALHSSSNIVMSNKVSGKIAIHAMSVSCKNALQSILVSKNLSQVTNGNVTYIDTKETITNPNVKKYVNKEYVDPVISVSFRKVRVRDALKTYAELKSNNIQSILESKNLSQVTNGNVAYIDTKEGITYQKLKEHVDTFIHLSFENVRVRALQNHLNLKSNNIVISNDVKGHMSLDLKDVPTDQVLDLIMLQNNLESHMVGDIMVIKTIHATE